VYGGYKVLDIHAHVSAPEETQAFLVSMIGSNTPVPSPYSAARRIEYTTQNRVSDERLRETFAKHVAYIDERNIDVQLLGPRPYTQFGWMEPHLTPAWARYVNDLIHLQCEMFPDRFIGACQLPQISTAPDTSHCVAEIERCVSEYGFAGVYASPDPDGLRTTPGMHEAYWFPLYEACESMDLPIIVHGTGTRDPRFRDIPYNYQLGFVTEQYLSVQFLRHGDVFDRFPRLRILVCHCGGALDRFIAQDPHQVTKDLSQNLFFDTCGYDLNFLEAAIKQRGVGSSCFGTEAPGSGRAVRPETGRTSDDLVPVIGEQFDWLTDADRRQIFHDNPAKLCPKLATL
jgi:predicted TIM-barrel fold metal-dependent hydrolase